MLPFYGGRETSLVLPRDPKSYLNRICLHRDRTQLNSIVLVVILHATPVRSCGYL